jgi:bifunctional DNA-binding transcriptional regulator/antitoxin component of YhaV-PrlF toxin-antitoxin module
VVLPAEARKRSGIKVGDPVFVEADPAGIHILTLPQILQRVQAAFAPYRRAGESIVDELIRERREEAAKEDRA